MKKPRTYQNIESVLIVYINKFAISYAKLNKFVNYGVCK